MLQRSHWLPLAFVLLGLIAAIFGLFQRYRAEARSRAVMLALDFPQLRSVAAAAGIPIPDALHRFKAAGITGVAITEETLGDLQASGVLSVQETAGASERRYLLKTADSQVGDRLATYLPHFIRGASDRAIAGDQCVLGTRRGTLNLPGRFDDLRFTPTGLDAGAVAQVREAGLEPVGRINNPLGADASTIPWELGELKNLGVRIVIFAGEEVLGYQGLVKDTADAFTSLGLTYGSVEFGKQRGDEELSRLLTDRMVRVHSIAAAEMPRLTPKEAIERYARAAVERNIRLDYVRLPATATENTFEDSVEYVRTLARQLAADGFGLATPVPFSAVWSSPILEKIVHATIGLGVAGGLVLLLAGIVPIPGGRQAVLTVGLGIVLGAPALTGSPLVLEGLALLAAVIFPTLAFVLFPLPLAAFEDHRHAAVRKRSEAIVPALGEFCAISAVTLIGALMVGAVLAELPFMVKVRSFVGIKASTVLPVLIVGWLYLTGMTGLYPDWNTEREEVAHRLRRFFSEPFRVWHIVALIVGVAVLALLVARSGNDSGIGVSETELKFRALLDHLLGARPRTKEFLVGHPALLLALAMAVSPKWRGWAFPLLLVGTIGQVGMLNSFCHLHTPLKVTVLRTIHGLWIGALLGLILVWLWTAFLKTRLGRDPRLE